MSFSSLNLVVPAQFQNRLHPQRAVQVNVEIGFGKFLDKGFSYFHINLVIEEELR